MHETQSTNSNTPFERIVRPLTVFAKFEASGGILLICCTVISLVWANSPWAGSYFHLRHTELVLGFGSARLSEPLEFWINDGLMAVFFLLVGLEIKREMLAGELASFQKASLPIAAALGGMVVPALIYALLNRGGAGAAGWGIPMATDIAFALGVLALLGDRVPASLKVFLAALAIADDIGAVLVIAVFYTAKISWISLAVGGAFLVALMTMNRSGARHPLIYTLLGLGLWLAFLKSGVHATVAGVLLAMTIPVRTRIEGSEFLARSEMILAGFRSAEAAGETIPASATKIHALEAIESICERAQSPLQRFEHALAPWIKHFIMPVFALANAGVVLGHGAAAAMVAPISLGVICGLVLGKPIGIAAFSWLATRSGVAALPDGVGWRQILGVGMIGGIGFTMSLFLAALAFGNTPELETAKVGVLCASAISGISGALVLLRGGKPGSASPAFQ